MAPSPRGTAQYTARVPTHDPPDLVPFAPTLPPPARRPLVPRHTTATQEQHATRRRRRARAAGAPPLLPASRRGGRPPCKQHGRLVSPSPRPAYHFRHRRVYRRLRASLLVLARPRLTASSTSRLAAVLIVCAPQHQQSLLRRARLQKVPDERLNVLLVTDRRERRRSAPVFQRAAAARRASFPPDSAECRIDHQNICSGAV